jgi:hypothetical protein
MPKVWGAKLRGMQLLPESTIFRVKVKFLSLKWDRNKKTGLVVKILKVPSSLSQLSLDKELSQKYRQRIPKVKDRKLLYSQGRLWRKSANLQAKMVC